jgi:hypothetical protein
MPIKCSAEILEAMSEAPIAHHVNEPSARKNLWSLFALLFSFYKYINHMRLPG